MRSPCCLCVSPKTFSFPIQFVSYSRGLWDHLVVCVYFCCYMWFVIHIVNKVNRTYVREIFTESPTLFCFPNGLLEVRSEHPAASTQVFLDFLCLQASPELVPKFQVATVCFSCNPPDLNSSKLSFIPVPPKLYVDINSVNQFNSCNVSILPLLLSEGQVG
jgi:hypothetical protein